MRCIVAILFIIGYCSTWFRCSCWIYWLCRVWGNNMGVGRNEGFDESFVQQLDQQFGDILVGHHQFLWTLNRVKRTPEE